MDFENNPMIYPPQRSGLNPFKVINERINDIEGEIKQFENTVGDVIDFDTNNINVNDINANDINANDINVNDITSNDINANSLDIANNASIKSLNVIEDINADNITTDNINVNFDINAHNISCDNLTVNEQVINQTITNQTVTGELKNTTLPETTPIESVNVVGYDANGKLIPIHAMYDLHIPNDAQFVGTTAGGVPTSLKLYDYIVDSQDKFNALMTMAKSLSGVTYKNIALVGGNGSGTNGEYIYTLTENDVSDGNFNNATITSYQSPKILVVLNNLDYGNLKVFTNINKLSNVEISMGGTVISPNVVTLFSSCNLEDSKILHADNAVTYYIKNSVFKNVTIQEVIQFTNCKFINSKNEKFCGFETCTFKDCDTVQSKFEDCNSDKLYVSTDSNINNKYQFINSGFDLDIRQSNLTQTDTVTINILSMTNTSLKCLDKESKYKKLIINCDSSDAYSEIIGNNDNPNLVSAKPINYCEKYVNPANIANAYINLNDSGRTPIYKDGTSYYLKPNDTTSSNKITVYVGESDSNAVISYKIGNGVFYYKSLDFNGIVTYDSDPDPIAHIPMLISKNKSDSCVKNNTEIKTYVYGRDTSNTLLYSNDNAYTMYLDDDLTTQVFPYTATVGGKSVPCFKLDGDGTYYADLSLTTVIIPDTIPSESFWDIYSVEVKLKNKDDYAVQVNSTSGNYINVKDAYLTTILA